MRNSILFFILFLIVSCGSNHKSQDNASAEKMLVSTVNYPVYYFAWRIAGDLIQIEYPIPANVDPAYWIPDDKALEAYQSADIILANGADYAKWMNNVTLPTSRIINTSKSVQEKYIELKAVSTHSHGPEGKHEHTGYAFTTWLDYQIAATQAEAIKETLIRKLPEKKAELEENYLALKSELLALDENMKDVSKLIENKKIIGSHPVYQYLAKAYSLNIQSVHFEPNEMPSEKQWQEFEHLIEHHPSSIMLWEDQPLPEVKDILNKKEIHVIVFNPCGNLLEGGDFIEIMNENIKILENSLRQ
jgi:zinc transport system substrate-binding protein